MQQNTAELINYLEGFVSDRRKQRLTEVLAERTRHMAIVLEDVYQGHNASAVLRSCDCFGVQDIHFIENRNNFKISEDVSMGATQWLTLKKYNSTENNTASCLKELKKQGYRIVATSPHKDDKTITELDVIKPFALVFGTEIDGITETVSEMADEFVKIPMYGFTESFNISVSAALCMNELMGRIRKQKIAYQINEAEKKEIYLEWLKASISKVDLIVKEFLAKK
ncbi:MAG TPA: RNA methyltransferase [Bacteroidia bacterium]|jgi:tRNA (guanosine-2'-O-)-methyltransferase|nr:RNA methyltransferase [Bacteroidia bacterium]